MKLPDFRAFAPFNALKDRMGVPRHVLGDLRVEISPGRLTLTELETLASPAGLDVSIDDVEVLADGTLSHKGQRVVVYIRDRAQYSMNYSDPRFHLANCSTLVQMRQNNHFGKYVASNNTSGRFEMNIIKHGKVRATTKELSVCQNCLDFLKFNNFSSSQNAHTREAAVVGFSLLNFFEKYPKSFHAIIPKYDAYSAPINDYPSAFNEVSVTIREKAGWICQEQTCRVDLSAPAYRKYLHAHHKNSEKYDNSDENLEALCIYCHASTPMHQHLRNSMDYKAFLSMRPSLLRRRA